MARTDKYILEGKTPIPCENLLEWAAWFSNADRKVANTNIGEYQISTVFLGMNHGWEGKPILFETMIFGFPTEHELCDYQTRCSTWGMAEKQHEQAVELVKEALKNKTT